MRSLRTWLHCLAWLFLILLLLSGCMEGQKTNPLKRTGPTSPTHKAPSEKGKTGEADKAK